MTTISELRDAETGFISIDDECYALLSDLYAQSAVTPEVTKKVITCSEKLTKFAAVAENFLKQTIDLDDPMSQFDILNSLDCIRARNLSTKIESRKIALEQGLSKKFTITKLPPGATIVLSYDDYTGLAKRRFKIMRLTSFCETNSLGAWPSYKVTTSSDDIDELCILPFQLITGTKSTPELLGWKIRILTNGKKDWTEEVHIQLGTRDLTELVIGYLS